MDHESSRLVYSVGRAICWAFCALYFRHLATGVERIPRHGGFLLASNHASYIDPVLLGVAVPRPLCYLARSSLFRPGPVSWLLKQVNCLALDRDGPGASGFRQGLKALRDGAGLVIFPEGTRSASGELGPLKRGVVHLARRAGVPVVPAWVAGSSRAFGRGKFVPRPVRTSVHFGEPFWISESMDLEDGLRQVEKSLQALQESVTMEREALPVG